VVALRDVRDRDPVAMQVGARQLLDPRERLRLDGADLHTVHIRPWRKVEWQRAARLTCCGGWTAREHALDEALHVAMQDAPFRPAALHLRQVDAELACKFPHGRTRMRLAG